MRVDVKADNLLEWLVLKMNVPPAPLLFTMQPLMARAVMAAAKFGVFAALESGPAGVDAVAERCGIHPRPTKKLLDALVNMHYLEYGATGYALSAMARKWMLPSDPDSLHENVLFRYVEWEAWGKLETFLETGTPMDVHEQDAAGWDWNQYQRGMRSLAAVSADEVAQRLPVPEDARDLLDIGGSHGLYSVKLCRRHANFSAVILDLPQAVEHAAPILAKENMGDRVVHRAGNVLTEDLGTDAYDVIFMSQLVHHFDADTNRALVQRIAHALRPGGVFAILDSFRAPTPGDAGYMGALLDLYFAMTSESGTWSVEEMQGWLRDAGLNVQAPIHLRSLPGGGLIVGNRRA